MRKTLVLSVALALLIVPTMAVGDSITPGDTYYLSRGDSLTIDKTVTMSAEDAGKLDVYFLVETTSSYGGLYELLAGRAIEIVNKLGSSVFGFGDVAYGVGRYSEFADGFFGFPASPGIPADVPFQSFLDISTGNAAAAKAALPLVAVDVPSGGDGPESSLYALHQVATTASWRPGAARVILWFGDSPGHDGDLEAGESPPYPSLIGQQDVMDAMAAYGVIVEGISLGGGLDSDAWSANNYPYSNHTQGTDICTGTGGTITNVDTLSSDFATEVLNAIYDAVFGGFHTFDTYDTVDLDVALAQLALLTTAYTPLGGYSVGYDRSIEHLFNFEVTFTAGSADATYTFPIWALLDGGKYLPEWDTIVIGQGGPPRPDVPEPSTLVLMGLGLAGLGFAARRKLRK